MSGNDPNEGISKSIPEKTKDGFVRFLRVAALIATLAGALGSLGFMLSVGRKSDSTILMLLFTIWVLSPFVGLVLATEVSKRFSVLTRTTLYGVMLVLSWVSLAIYGFVALNPPGPKPAFAFLVVPLGSWLLIAVLIPITTILAGRRSRRGNGD